MPSPCRAALPLVVAAALLVAAEPTGGAAESHRREDSRRDRELADIYERIGDLYNRPPVDYQAIVRLYERVATLAPGTEDAKGALAEIYHLHKDRGQWPAALGALDRLERLYPDQATIEVGNEPTMLKAVILAERGLYQRDVVRDLEKARLRFEELLARYPQAIVTTDGFRGLGPEGYGGRAAAFARLALAEAESRAGRMEVAEALLFALIRSFPAEPLLLYEGESYFDEAALLTFRRLTRQRGLAPPVAFYDRVATDSAHEYVRVRARELAAEAQVDLAGTLALGDAQGRRAQYEAAIARYRELIDRHPTFTFAFYGETEHHAVKALDRIVDIAVKRLGDPARAAAECERVAVKHAAVADLAAAALFAEATVRSLELRDLGGAALALRRIVEAYPEALRYPQPLEGGERLADAARALLDGSLAPYPSPPAPGR